jgi:hypothetical protein
MELGKWLLPMIGDALAYNGVYFIIAFSTTRCLVHIVINSFFINIDCSMNTYAS